MSNVIIEYGSAARGDSNEKSDVDLVCVWAGAPPDYCAIEAKYKGVIFYSAESIKRMRQKGSLFLTHLDIDSVFLEGDRKLLNLFKGYRPPNVLLERSLNDTQNFISNIKWFPNTIKGELWLSDVLYVALRNCIYCINAIKERYLFGYEDALSELSLTAHQADIMMALRSRKYAYRNEEYENFPDVDVTQLEEVTCAILGASQSFTAGGSTDWMRNWRYDYWDERLLERAVLNGEHIDQIFLEQIRRHNYNKILIKSHMMEIINQHL